MIGTDLNPKLTKTTRLADVLGTRAQARVVSPGSGNNFVVTALQRGAAANGYTIQFIDSGTVTAGNETVGVVGSTITVDIQSGHTTAAQVVQALNSDPTFNALFQASVDPDESAGDQPVSLSATAVTSRRQRRRIRPGIGVANQQWRENIHHRHKLGHYG